MKSTILTRSASFTMVALFAGTMVFSFSPANAGNAYGKDNNPGKAKGHAENGGPATPGASAKGHQASAMGSLNAAHASAKAFEHANPRSRVGALAAYMGAMTGYKTKHDDFDKISAEIADIDAEIADLSNQVAALDPDDPEYEAQKADLGDKIATLERYKDTLQDDAETLAGELEATVDAAAHHLKNAANKDRRIDASVVDAVNRLLDGKSGDFTHSGVVHESEKVIANIINGRE